MIGLAKSLKRIASGLKEESKPEIEEHVLEHFLLYHGLIGSSAENEKEKHYRDVRADIKQAVDHSSSTELSIALKLPPLFWADRLEAIFSEIAAENFEAVVKILLPNEDEGNLIPNQIPLKHDDWRVRANAARMLAHLSVCQSDQKIIEALNDRDDNFKAAFCHLAIALAKLQSEAGKNILMQHLYSNEPWFRVDAVYALAHWNLNDVTPELMKTFLNPNTLADYMSVAIARKYKVSDLLNDDRPIVVAAAQEIIIGISQAANNTFGEAVIAETKVLECTNTLKDMLANSPSLRTIQALKSVKEWLDGHPTSEENNGSINLQLLSDQKIQEKIIAAIQNPNSDDSLELKHAICLAGDLRLANASAPLIKMLSLDHIFIDEIIQSLGGIAESGSERHLIDFCKQIINIEERTNGPLSKKSILEENQKAARAYWFVLKALAQLPSSATLDFLLKTVGDKSSDMREQSVVSLIQVGNQANLKKDYQTQIQSTIAKLLKDPSSAVRKQAISAVAIFHLVDLAPFVIKEVGSKEVSVYKAGLDALTSLINSGSSTEIIELIKKQTAFDINDARRKRLIDLLQQAQTSNVLN